MVVVEGEKFCTSFIKEILDRINLRMKHIEELQNKYNCEVKNIYEIKTTCDIKKFDDRLLKIRDKCDDIINEIKLYIDSNDKDLMITGRHRLLLKLITDKNIKIYCCVCCKQITKYPIKLDVKNIADINIKVSGIHEECVKKYN